MVESFLYCLLGILLLSYIIIHYFAWKGLRNLLYLTNDVQHSFSIIVAAHNEEKVIESLLSSFVNLQYPINKFEIIIANDRSTDSTQTIIESYTKKYSHVKSLDIKENTTDMPNKKNALREAIKVSRNEILVLTDADCIVPPSWLSEITKYFSDEVGVVAGYSPNKLENPKQLFNSFLRFQELQSSISAAAGIGNSEAFMCNGRNFSYRRKVYDEVDGFDKIKQSISGDDDLFLQLMQKETKWSIRYMTTPESYVYTQPPVGFRQFIKQKIRHISASKYYSLKINVMYGALHLFNISFLVLLLFSPMMAFVVLMVKFNVDAVIIAQCKDIFKEEFSIVEFFRNELLLIIFTLFIGPLGLFKKVEWNKVRS